MYIFLCVFVFARFSLGMICPLPLLLLALGFLCRSTSGITYQTSLAVSGRLIKRTKKESENDDTIIEATLDARLYLFGCNFLKFTAKCELKSIGTHYFFKFPHYFCKHLTTTFIFKFSMEQL